MRFDIDIRTLPGIGFDLRILAEDADGRRRLFFDTLPSLDAALRRWSEFQDTQMAKLWFLHTHARSWLDGQRTLFDAHDTAFAPAQAAFLVDPAILERQLREVTRHMPRAGKLGDVVFLDADGSRARLHVTDGQIVMTRAFDVADFTASCIFPPRTDDPLPPPALADEPAHPAHPARVALPRTVLGRLLAMHREDASIECRLIDGDLPIHADSMPTGPVVAGIPREPIRCQYRLSDQNAQLPAIAIHDASHIIMRVRAADLLAAIRWCSPSLCRESGGYTPPNEYGALLVRKGDTASLVTTDGHRMSLYESIAADGPADRLVLRPRLLRHLEALIKAGCDDVLTFCQAEEPAEKRAGDRFSITIHGGSWTITAQNDQHKFPAGTHSPNGHEEIFANALGAPPVLRGLVAAF